jgi:hypothetical protein
VTPGTSVLAFESHSNGQNDAYVIDDFAVTAVLKAYGFDERSQYPPDELSDGSENPNRVVLGYGGEIASKISAPTTPENVTATPTPEATVTSPLMTPRIPRVGRTGALTGTATHRTARHASTIATHKPSHTTPAVANTTATPARPEHRTSKSRKVAALVLSGIAVIGGAAFHNRNDNYTKTPNIALAAAHIKNAGFDTRASSSTSSSSTAAAGETSSTTIAKVETSSTTKGATTSTSTAETTTTLSPATKEALTNANMAKLSEIGLKPDQYNIVTNPDAVLPGTLQADDAGPNSLDRGIAAWKNLPFTFNGAKQLVAEELNGSGNVSNDADGTYSASDASVTKQGFEKFNVPDSIIAQIGAKNFNNIVATMVTLSPNITSATYYNIVYNNNGIEADSPTRLVAPANQDAIIVFSYLDANGNEQSVAVRVDCGWQAFSSLSVETPAPAPEVTTTTAPEVTTTTEEETTTTLPAPTTTSTTAPASTTTSTTTPAPTTTSTTTPASTTTSTVPASTTTSTTVPPTTSTTRPCPPSTTVPPTTSTTEVAPTTSTTEAPTTTTTTTEAPTTTVPPTTSTTRPCPPSTTSTTVSTHKGGDPYTTTTEAGTGGLGNPTSPDQQGSTTSLAN